MQPSSPPPYAYPYYLPPLPQDNTRIIIALLVGLMLIVLVGDVLVYQGEVNLAGAIQQIPSPSPSVPPVVLFANPSTCGLGECLTVASVSQAIELGNYQVNLGVNGNVGSPMSFPAHSNKSAGGPFSALTVGGAYYRVNWTQTGMNTGLLVSGDSFAVTHTDASGTLFMALPSASNFTFYLLFADGSTVTTVNFATLSRPALAFALTTNRSNYSVGDTVNVSITLTNVGSGTAVLHLPNPCSVVFLVYNDTRQVVFNSTEYWGCIQVVWNLNLAPGASQAWAYRWGLVMNNGTPVNAPGTYALVPSFVWGLLYQENVVRTDIGTIAVTP